MPGSYPQTLKDVTPHSMTFKILQVILMGEQSVGTTYRLKGERPLTEVKLYPQRAKALKITTVPSPQVSSPL